MTIYIDHVTGRGLEAKRASLLLASAMSFPRELEMPKLLISDLSILRTWLVLAFWLIISNVDK